MHVNQTLKFQNMHDENENYINLLQPAKYPPILKFPPILIIEFQGLPPPPPPPPPACTLHKDHNMATANKNINKNIVAVEDLKI